MSLGSPNRKRPPPHPSLPHPTEVLPALSLSHLLSTPPRVPAFTCDHVEPALKHRRSILSAPRRSSSQYSSSSSGSSVRLLRHAERQCRSVLRTESVPTPFHPSSKPSSRRNIHILSFFQICLLRIVSNVPAQIRQLVFIANQMIKRFGKPQHPPAPI